MTGTVPPIEVLLLGGVSTLVIEVKERTRTGQKKIFQPKDPPYSTELV